MKVSTEFIDYANVWTAVDSDTYDGAPDADPENQIIGYGKTEAEAIIDLDEQIKEFENS